MSLNDWASVLAVIGSLASIVALVDILSRWLPSRGAARASSRRPLGLTFPFGVAMICAVLITGGLVYARGGVGCEVVLIASSQEKVGLMQTFRDEYNSTAPSVPDGGGRCVTISVEMIRSGQAEAGLEAGWAGRTDPAPDVWTPASSQWVLLLTESRSGYASRVPVGFANFSLFKSPTVIGMPLPMAQALGYPKPISWLQIIQLAKSPDGWGSVGRPELGAFRFGRTNPHISTSGLHSLVSQYNALSADGSVAAVAVAAPTSTIIERSALHYAATATDFLRNLLQVDRDSRGADLSYVSAIAVEEKELTDYNRGLIGRDQRPPPFTKLVAIYPSEGTIVADHPYVILNQRKAAAALGFFNFIESADQLAAADDKGFRQATGFAGKSLSARPFINPNPPALAREPSLAVLRAELSAWDQERKPARVLVLVDTAADKAKLRAVQNQVANALSKLQKQDQVELAQFPGLAPSTPYTVVQPWTSMDAEGQVQLKAKLAALSPAGGQGPNKAAGANLDAPVEAAVRQFPYDPGAIDAILLIEVSPGSEMDATLDDFLATQARDRYVRLFTVGPAGDPLDAAAIAGEGASYQPDSTSDLLVYAISNF